MTVAELIEELEKYPKDIKVELGSVVDSFGEAVRVIYYPNENMVEIECN